MFEELERALNNLAVLQSGGPTAVLNASLVGIIREARNRFDGVLGLRRGFQGLLDGQTVDLLAIPDDQLYRLTRTPSAGLGMSRLRPTNGQLQAIVEALGEMSIAALIGIGGNDTAETLDRLARAARETGLPLQVIGLPKTIDNDLPETDHCLGFPSAARFLAAYARDGAVDASATSSQYKVKLIEVMGRNAGWLAASTALWIPDTLPRPIVALPERPFRSAESALELIERQIAENGHAVVVVPETMRWTDGEHVAGAEPEWVDAFGHPYHGSAGQALLRLVGQQLGFRGRVDRPGTVSRASIDLASDVDLREAVACGRFAVQSLLDGADRRCVVIRRRSSSPYESTQTLVSLDSIANVERTLPDSMIEPSGHSLTREFFEYAEPLVGPPSQDYLFIDWS